MTTKKTKKFNDITGWDLIEKQHTFLLTLLDNIITAMVFVYILPQNNSINLLAVLNPKYL